MSPSEAVSAHASQGLFSGGHGSFAAAAAAAAAASCASGSIPMDPRQSLGMISPLPTVRRNTSSISRGVTYPYHAPKHERGASSSSGTEDAFFFCPRPEKTPPRGANTSTFPAYLCPPTCEHPRTSTLPRSSLSAATAARNASTSAGPHTPHRASRDACVHTNTCALEAMLVDSASSPSTTTLWTNAAISFLSRTRSGPSLCLRICGNKSTSPTASPATPPAAPGASARLSFTLPTAFVPASNLWMPPLYVPDASSSASCMTTAGDGGWSP